jgi:hypothetical protein
MTDLEAAEKALVDRFDFYVRNRVRDLIDNRVIEEYRANPRGPHSDELSRVLNYFRRGTIRRKYALLARPHFRKYQVIQLSGMRDQRPTEVPDHAFDNQREADFAIFMLRVAELMKTESEDTEQ